MLLIKTPPASPHSLTEQAHLMSPNELPGRSADRPGSSSGV